MFFCVCITGFYVTDYNQINKIKHFTVICIFKFYYQIIVFFRNGSYIDKNIRNANQLLPYIQKDNNLIFYLTGYTYNIDSDNVKMITNGMDRKLINIFYIILQTINSQFFFKLLQHIYIIRKIIF